MYFVGLGEPNPSFREPDLYEKLEVITIILIMKHLLLKTILKVELIFIVVIILFN